MTETQWLIFWLVFFAVNGACVGSFLNVVVYRLPLGLSIVTPPSSCPKCGHKLAWYDNVPVLGWLWLRGKCRYCGNPISPQYPIMEALCAAMFAMLFAGYYILSHRAALPGHPADFHNLGWQITWPIFVIHLFLLGGLIASTKIDANLYIIPLEIPWCVTVIAVLALPIAAIFLPPATANVTPATLMLLDPNRALRSTAMPLPGWAIGAAFGGAVGLVIAIILLRRGLLPLSFDERKLMGDAGESPSPKKETKKQAAKSEAKKEKKPQPPGKKKKKKGKKGRKKGGDKQQASESKASTQDDDDDEHAEEAHAESRRGMLIYMLGMAVVAVAAFATGSVIGMVVAFAILWWGILIVDFGAYGELPKEEGPEHWLVFPNPRFEAMKEILFLLIPLAAAVLGIVIVSSTGLATTLAGNLPVRTLGGAVYGYLIGGGVVWAVRILGTLGFGKEAMGLGDVHLVGAIGAVLGPVDAVLLFFMAAFLGIAHTAIVSLVGRLLLKRGLQIPYGPHLCGAAVILMIFRHPVVQLLNELGVPIR